jgi:hypothetical protein
LDVDLVIDSFAIVSAREPVLCGTLREVCERASKRARELNGGLAARSGTSGGKK